MKNNSIYSEKLINELCYPRVKAYYFRKWKNYSMAPHIHDRIEIMYVIKGKCCIETDKKELKLINGDFILIDANVSHALIVDGEDTCKMLNVEIVFENKKNNEHSLNKLIDSSSAVKYLIKGNKPYMVLKDTDGIYELLQGIIREMDEKNTDYDLMVNFYVYQVLIRTGRLLLERKSRDEVTSGMYVKKAIRYMNDNYNSDIDVENIAKVINIHPGYLHRIFKINTRETVMDYLRRLRISKAEVLLQYTDMPIIDIAENVGISSRQYFSYFFKKYTGVSPAQYRKNIDKYIG